MTESCRDMSGLVVDAVRKSFGAVEVLHGVDLTVAAGSTTAVVGSSGCGKTTLLRIIAGFEHPGGGSVRVGGTVVVDGTRFVPVAQLPPDHRFHQYQRVVNAGGVPTEQVIAAARAKLPDDYRYESQGPNPVPGLRPEKERRGATTEYAEHPRMAAE